MAEEIERKFLVRNDHWRASVHKSTQMRQGYLCTDADRNVRVRTKGEKAVLTIKGRTEGLRRLEFEYDIPREDAEAVLSDLCLPWVIEKTRHLVEYDGLLWEIDEFAGVNQGLIVAEVELESEEQAVSLPQWVGEEVSHDPKYLNANLVSRPFKDW